MPDALRLPPAREGGLDPHHLVHHHFSERRCFAPFAGTGEPPVEALLPLTPASAIDWPTRKRWIKSSMPASGEYGVWSNRSIIIGAGTSIP
jgi:hypothetical protein